MKNRVILVINPRSSGFSLIQHKILPFLNDEHFEKKQIETFEIQPTSPMENAREMAKGLREGDTILVAGGDGTAHIATNAAIISGKNGLKIKYTGFGNFNDYAHSFSANSGRAAAKAIDSGEIKAKIRPLKISINGEFFRYAPLYATVGLTAEMAEIFEHPKVRNTLKKTHGRNIRLVLSLMAATRFYFKNRKKHTLKIAKIELDGADFTDLAVKNATDLVFLNGPRMARIMRSRINKTDAENFGFGVLNAGDFRRNLPFLAGGLAGKIPLKRAKKVKIEFAKSAKIPIQIEGEAQCLTDVKTLEIEIGQGEVAVL